MIVSAIQKGGMIYIYTDKGMKTRTGYLVSFTSQTVNHLCSKTSRTIYVVDENLKVVRTFVSPVAITSGPGWSK